MTQISRVKSAAVSPATGMSRRGWRSAVAAPAAASIALVSVRWELFRLGAGEDAARTSQGPWELSLVVAMDRSQPDRTWRGTVQISPAGDRRVIALEQFALSEAESGEQGEAGVPQTGSGTSSSGAAAVLRVDRAAGLVHVDAPGFLSATFEIDRAGAARVLFASSPMLAAMKIPGGTYEVLGGTLTRVL